MKRTITICAAVCCALLAFTGCSSRSPNLSAIVAQTKSASRTVKAELDFTTADQYHGSFYLTGKTDVSEKRTLSKYEISVSTSASSDAYLNFSAYTDSSENQTLLDSPPDVLIDALAPDDTQDEAISVTGSDTLGTHAVLNHFLSYIKGHAADADFESASHNPFSLTRDGDYTWSISANTVKSLLSPLLSAENGKLGSTIVQNVDTGMPAKLKKAIAAGGRAYALGVTVQDGYCSSITLVSTGYQAVQETQAEKDAWYGGNTVVSTPSVKLIDGLNLTINLSENEQLALSLPENSVKAG